MSTPQAVRVRQESTPTGGVFSSEEGREFLQKRIAAYARICALISSTFLVSNWLIGVFGGAGPVPAGYTLATWQIVHLLATAVLAAVWLAARGRALPLSTLRLLEGSGTILTGSLFALMILSMPFVFRPDMVALLALMALLLYRSAMVPSEARRTAIVAALSMVAVPFFTYALFVRTEEPVVARLFTFYAALWSFGTVLIATVTASVIYGLQRSFSEARRLGQYTLLEKIGQGGMGAVYRAQHALLRRPTAIKLLPPELAGDVNWKRFEREVQMTALLTSPHTVSIYDFGRTPDGVFYYAMEYLDGIDLETLVVKEGPLPPGRVVHILVQVCSALHEAHEAGLLHRDIKPANMILCERGGTHDFVKVVDFGLVREIRPKAATTLTSENSVQGTPHYMAPEAIKSDGVVRVPSDIYSLAATAYYLLTAQTVFDGAPIVVFSHHLDTAPEPPSSRLDRPLPPRLEAAVLAGLSKDPSQRPQSARELAAILAACDDVEPWTQADAEAWWNGHIGSLHRRATRPVPGRQAVDIDLAERE